MHRLYKPSGKEMNVNDTSLETALSMGWTKEDPTAVKVEAPKPKQTKKAK